MSEGVIGKYDSIKKKVIVKGIHTKTYGFTSYNLLINVLESKEKIDFYFSTNFNFIFQE